MADSNTQSNSRVWLITGCSTGFGRALAEAVLNQGDPLIATDRKPEQLQDLVESYSQQVHTSARSFVVTAIANAIYHTTGKRICDLPITTEKLL